MQAAVADGKTLQSGASVSYDLGADLYNYRPTANINPNDSTFGVAAAADDLTELFTIVTMKSAGAGFVGANYYDTFQSGSVSTGVAGFTDWAEGGFNIRVNTGTENVVNAPTSGNDGYWIRFNIDATFA